MNRMLTALQVKTSVCWGPPGEVQRRPPLELARRGSGARSRALACARPGLPEEQQLAAAGSLC